MTKGVSTGDVGGVRGVSETITVDCQYLQPKFAAAYLCIDRGSDQSGDLANDRVRERAVGSASGSRSHARAFFVDNNTAHSVPLLLRGLDERGLRPEEVGHLIITHVHLDHAGGSYALMKACPNAVLLAHPRAAKHVIDPSRLVASAKAVYGERKFEELYGEIGPIPADRVREVADEEVLELDGHRGGHLGERSLRFLHTRGHANHHICIEQRGPGVEHAVFTGDAFGLAYPALQRQGLFIFPSTSPTDFDPEEARRSIRRIVGTGARKAYLTHYGAVENLEAASRQLMEHLDFSEALLIEAVSSAEPDEGLESFCGERLNSHFRKVLERQGLGSDSAAWELIRLDLELNAAGIAHVARKRRAERSSTQEKPERKT